MDLVTKLKSELDRKSAEAETAWGEFQTYKAHLEDNDVAVTDVKSDEFTALNEKYGAYTAITNEVAELKSRWEAAVNMENSNQTAGGDLSYAAEPEVKSGFHLVTSPEFKSLATNGTLNSGAKVPSGIHLGTAASPAEFKAAITSLSRPMAGNMGTLAPLGGRLLSVLDVVQIDGNAVQYVRQTTRSGQATPVAEGGIKPESNAAVELVTAPLENIAVWKNISRQALADESRFASFVESVLTDDLQLVLEGQVLNGNGTTPNMRGILATAGVSTYDLAGADTPADGLLRGIAQVQAAGGEPDAIAMNPADFARVRLLKDADGNYVMGPPNIPGAANIWGVPVVISAAVTAGRALVGAFRQGSTLYLNGGVEVHTTDSHGTNFTSNIVTVLVEQRAALAVEVPSLFSSVDLVVGI